MSFHYHTFEQGVDNLIPYFSCLSETEFLSDFSSATLFFICDDTFCGTGTGLGLVMDEMLFIGLVVLQKGVRVLLMVTALNYLLGNEGCLVITSNYYHKIK